MNMRIAWNHVVWVVVACPVLLTGMCAQQWDLGSRAGAAVSEASENKLKLSFEQRGRYEDRTGSAFGIQARFPQDKVRIEGRATEYVRISDEADREAHTFHFCPDCGATVFFTDATAPDVVKVPVGAFADPSFPPPTISIYESRRHAWLTVPAEMEHDDW